MCSNFYSNNVRVRSKVPINSINIENQIEYKIKSMLDRPTKNFKFIFGTDPTLNYLQSIAQHQKIKNYLMKSVLSICFWNMKTSFNYINLYRLNQLNPFNTHDIKCDLYLIQRREQILINSRKTPIKTDLTKKCKRCSFEIKSSMKMSIAINLKIQDSLHIMRHMNFMLMNLTKYANKQKFLRFSIQKR
jgi:hypothetical protein